MQKIVEVSASNDGAEKFVIVATFLPVNKWRNVIPFLRLASKIEAQVKASSGSLRYGLKTDILHKRFWTVSVWRDRTAMQKFVRTEPHLTAIAKFPKWAGKGAAFVLWESPDGRIMWNEVETRLRTPTFYYQK